jgi:hypothetical protein
MNTAEGRGLGQSFETHRHALMGLAYRAKVVLAPRCACVSACY